MTRLLIIALLSLFTVLGNLSCAPLPRPAPVNIVTSAIVDLSFDTTWTILVENLASRKILIKTIMRDSGFIDAEMSLPTEIVADYAWTGSNLPSMLNPYGRIKANIFVKQVSTVQTSVQVNSIVEVYQDMSGVRLGSSGWIEAKSKGIFESEILSCFNIK